MAGHKTAKDNTDRQKTGAEKAVRQTWKPQKPRRWTPKQAQRIIGRLLVPSILIVLVAVYFRQSWILLPAFLLWAVMALILYKYWRCPECGKTLPKTGKTFECPRCGAKIE